MFYRCVPCRSLNISYHYILHHYPNFNLPNLTWLNLSGNQLSGSIPNFNFPNLTDLYLYSNQLTGSIPNFTDLPNLQSLDLGGNQLSGSIPSFTSFNLTNLYSVGFRDNCGLTAFDATQETVLNQKDPSWKARNPDCGISLSFTLFGVILNKAGNGSGNVYGYSNYKSGTTVTLHAYPDVNSIFTPDNRHIFKGWSPSPCADSFVMPAQNLICTATFTEQFALTVDKVGNGTVSNGGSFVAGATVNLTATPDAGYKFIGWNPSTCKDSFAMPAQNITCTATFEKIVDTTPLPVVSQCATFTPPAVNIPCVNVGGTVYQAKMNLISNTPTMRFEVDTSSLQSSNLIPNEQCAVFPAPNTLDHLRINCLDLGDKYWVDLKLVNANPIQFDLVNYAKN